MVYYYTFTSMFSGWIAENYGLTSILLWYANCLDNTEYSIGMLPFWWQSLIADRLYVTIGFYFNLRVSLLSIITLIDIGDKYCMSFSAAVAARLVQLKFQVIYKKKCTKRFCLEYNSNECTCKITYYICSRTNSENSP